MTIAAKNSNPFCLLMAVSAKDPVLHLLEADYEEGSDARRVAAQRHKP